MSRDYEHRFEIKVHCITQTLQCTCETRSRLLRLASGWAGAFSSRHNSPVVHWYSVAGCDTASSLPLPGLRARLDRHVGIRDDAWSTSKSAGVTAAVSWEAVAGLAPRPRPPPRRRRRRSPPATDSFSLSSPLPAPLATVAVRTLAGLLPAPPDVVVGVSEPCGPAQALSASFFGL